MNAKRLRRLPVVGCLTAGGLVLLAAGPAFAHVSVQPGEAEKGGYSTINFKVPNERDDASTVKLEVTLPSDHPLASVMPQPVPGWDIKVTKSKLAKPVESHGEKINEAVTKVTWSGGKIEPGMFQQFPVSVGQLPEDADQMVFKALQTYDNKEVVRWIEEPKEGAAEPENPAPVLKLVDPAKGADGQGADASSGKAKDATAGSEAAASDASDASNDKDGSDTTARVLGIAGIVIGAAGVAFGVVAGRRRSA
ncbi:YcnI family copper-binding membrane protein [Streptomyces hygroscopicus]|uniref:YcnI family copper-binding membrane protein n=1 Tax=Streptomyces hygroscopicus TaxID=1912 RepID=UPI0004C58E15|nr:YcnI family protein [Streptomyces hygroscopicus]